MKPTLRHRHLKAFPLELKGTQRHGYANQYFLAIEYILLNPFGIKTWMFHLPTTTRVATLLMILVNIMIQS